MQVSNHPFRTDYPTRKKWLAAKNAARKRSNRILRATQKRICAHCDSTDRYGRKAPGCHHIDGDCFNWDPGNLQWLCRDCHDKEHGIVPTRPVELRAPIGECVSIHAEANRRAFFARP